MPVRRMTASSASCTCCGLSVKNGVVSMVVGAGTASPARVVGGLSKMAGALLVAGTVSPARVVGGLSKMAGASLRVLPEAHDERLGEVDHEEEQAGDEGEEHERRQHHHGDRRERLLLDHGDGL